MFTGVKRYSIYLQNYLAPREKIVYFISHARDKPERQGPYLDPEPAGCSGQKDTMQTITGNTYPVREKIKALGGRWNKAAQGWDVEDGKAEEARALVTAAGPSTFTPRASRYTRFSGGGEMYQNSRGRCEDAPCCGCCT